MRVRLLRGRVAIRELKGIERGEYRGEIWTPERDAYDVKTHRGTVVAKGPPALHSFYDRDSDRMVHHEVPQLFEVGDTVQFHFNHLESSWTVPWPEDGLPIVVVPQECVDGVVERDPA